VTRLIHHHFFFSSLSFSITKVCGERVSFHDGFIETGYLVPFGPVCRFDRSRRYHFQSKNGLPFFSIPPWSFASLFVRLTFPLRLDDTHLVRFCAWLVVFLSRLAFSPLVVLTFIPTHPSGTPCFFLVRQFSPCTHSLFPTPRTAPLSRFMMPISIPSEIDSFFGPCFGLNCPFAANSFSTSKIESSTP